MNPVAITGSDPQSVGVLFEYAARAGLHPWIIWNATADPAPDALAAKGRDRLLEYRAIAYVAECHILTLRKIMDRTNADYAWTVDADMVACKDLPGFDDDLVKDDDVLLGLGFSRFSRRALECIARDFGTGLDYSELKVSTL
jgi:hypothetical protein